MSVVCDLSPGGVICLPKVQGLPIATRNKTWIHKVIAWLFESRNYQLTEDYIITIPWMNVQILIPRGFIFDGASVPRIFWSILDPLGILYIPSIIHDFGYRYNALLNQDREIIFTGAGKMFFDDLFRKVAVEVNELPIIDTVSWAALFSFGWLPWNNNRKENLQVDKDFPNIQPQDY